MFKINIKIINNEYDDFAGESGFIQIKCNDKLYGEIWSEELADIMSQEYIFDWLNRLKQGLEILKRRDYVLIADIESYNTWIELKRNRDSLIFSIVKGETPDGSTDIEFHADNIVPGAWTDQKILFEEFETEVNNTIADYMHYIETHNTNKNLIKKIKKALS